VHQKIGDGKKWLEVGDDFRGGLVGPKSHRGLGWQGNFHGKIKLGYQVFWVESINKL
jgi:hypothetical protein